MYHVEKNTQEKYCELFGKTEELLNKDVENLKKWVELQPHFPEIMDEAIIRNFLNLCKFNVDRAKEKIENYYTSKSRYPEVFRDCNPKLPHMKSFLEEIHLCNHPQLLDGLHRVIFIKWKGKKNCFDTQKLIKLFFCIYEMRLLGDVMVDDVVIVDFTNLTFKDITRTSPFLVFKSYSVYKNVFSLRLKALHFVNSPSYISLVLRMLKYIFSQKLYERIKVHQDAESLKQIFSTEMLPKDYGGTAPSLQELDDMMRKEYHKYQERFDKLDDLRDKKE